MAHPEVWILGASGHAKVVIAILRAAGYEPRGLYDDDPLKVGKQLLGVPILGPLDLLSPDHSGPLAHGIGSNAVRAKLVARFPRAQWVNAVHPTA